MAAAPVKGDKYIAFGDRRPCERLWVEVTRVAKDGSWADVMACTWAVAWTKRMPLPFTDARRRDWTNDDIIEAFADFEAREAGDTE